MRVVTNPKSFSTMFREVKKKQGATKEQAEKLWNQYLNDNPGLASMMGRRTIGDN